MKTLAKEMKTSILEDPAQCLQLGKFSHYNSILYNLLYSHLDNFIKTDLRLIYLGESGSYLLLETWYFIF